MTLSPREKWIHLYTTISITARVNGESDDFIRGVADAMRHERCRKLTDKERDEIIDEMEEERIGCIAAMGYILEQMESNTCRGAAV